MIGAGAAGLSATAHLISKGKSVLCIEAMNRIGGRCYTDMTTFGVPADHGADRSGRRAVGQLINSPALK